MPHTTSTTRRDVLKLAGGAASLAALGGKPLPAEVVASSDDPTREVRRQRPQKQTDFFSGLFGN